MAGGEQVLADLWVPDLASRGKNVQARLEQQRWQAATAGFDIESRKRWRVAEQTAVTTSAEWHGLQAERSQFLPRAPYSGQFFLTDPDLAAGQWVGKKDALGVLVKQGTAWRVETWLDEDEVARVSVGQRASFQIDSMTGTRLSLRVVAIDRDAARILHRRELASISGGHVITREKNGQLVPERAVYRAVLALDQQPEDFQPRVWRGRLTIHSDWQSPAGRYLRQAALVLVREVSF